MPYLALLKNVQEIARPDTEADDFH